MATDANTLLAETACYECLSEAEWRMIQLGLLQQILLANSPMADTSANALMEAAKCYRCLSEAEWRMIELALLQQIVDGGGGGGGGGQIVAYTTTGPTADGVLPADLNEEAIAVKPGGATFIWNSTTHVWDDV